MNTLENFSKTELKREIVKKYGSVRNLKAQLKKDATYEYGTWMNEVLIYGCRIIYTSNPNSFASFIIRIPHLGYSSEYGLGKSSITKAGERRLRFSTGQYYIQL